MNKGLFITLEGAEGVGKSTQMAFIADVLTQSGRTVVETREPGGTATGEAIREIVLNNKELNISAETELLMIFSARAQHVSEIILPALERGDTVLCDRFTDATYAYQGGGRGIAEDRIRILENWVQAQLRPDLTLLFDAPVETGLGRASKRSAADRFESETMAFFEKVRQAYLALAVAEPERFVIIDATPDINEVQRTIKQELEAKGLC